jgi:hypothetical protein
MTRTRLMFCPQAMNRGYIDVRRRSVDLELAMNYPVLRSRGPCTCSENFGQAATLDWSVTLCPRLSKRLT